MWFPDLYQIDTKKRNPNYWNSVFIGLTAPFLNLGGVLIDIFFRFIKGLFDCVLAIIVLGICGLFGRVTARNIDREAREVELAYKDITGKDLDAEKFLEDPAPYLNEVTTVVHNHVADALVANRERRQRSQK